MAEEDDLSTSGSVFSVIEDSDDELVGGWSSDNSEHDDIKDEGSKQRQEKARQEDGSSTSDRGSVQEKDSCKSTSFRHYVSRTFHRLIRPVGKPSALIGFLLILASIVMGWIHVALAVVTILGAKAKFFPVKEICEDLEEREDLEDRDLEDGDLEDGDLDGSNVEDSDLEDSDVEDSDVEVIDVKDSDSEEDEEPEPVPQRKAKPDEVSLGEFLNMGEDFLKLVQGKNYKKGDLSNHFKNVMFIDSNLREIKFEDVLSSGTGIPKQPKRSMKGRR